MDKLLAQLEGLNSTITSIVVQNGSAVSPSEVDAYIRAIQRKVKFTSVHLKILEGAIWKDAENLGRSLSGGTKPLSLEVNLNDAILSISHVGALTDHTYIAFDGLIAAVSNMTDTFSRLINRVYSLKINQYQTNLLNVGKKCGSTSPLGQILQDSQHTTWLKMIRDLRGRCQHADVEDVLVVQAGPLSCRTEPLISKDYSWANPQVDSPLVQYAKDALGATELTLSAAVLAVLSAPQNPTI